jgi:hypothetical protein
MEECLQPQPVAIAGEVGSHLLAEETAQGMTQSFFGERQQVGAQVFPDQSHRLRDGGMKRLFFPPVFFHRRFPRGQKPPGEPQHVPLSELSALGDVAGDGVQHL